MAHAISIHSVDKRYENGFQALQDVNLQINKGEIFALLGPNGAGKTTLIGTICGIVTPSSGTIAVLGFDHQKQYRQARQAIGLVPQELTTEAFETVLHTVRFSRGLFGKPKNDAYIEEILKKLSLWDKKDVQLMKLSGGMKRRVMIAKALAHEPEILFLDEPTAGVDIELRKSMWEQVRALKELGVTIILTTHYIEEAEEMADRIGVINKGQLVLVEEKDQLIEKMGSKTLRVELTSAVSILPERLQKLGVSLGDNGSCLLYSYDVNDGDETISSLFKCLDAEKIRYKDISTKQSSLEDIFMQLLKERQ